LETLLGLVVLEVQLQQVAEAEEEGAVVGAAVVREEMERMVLLVLLEQVGQGAQAFHLRFLNTMVEMPKSMVQVEMAGQTHSLVSPLEQAVRQIQEKVVAVEVPRPFGHQPLAASLLWAEQEVPG
jgi:hypothetical protein